MKSKNEKSRRWKENGSKRENKRKHAGENDACHVTGINIC